MTMGGEPTFVSIDDMESAQWNTAADGPEKRILSHNLIFRLREKFGPEGMIHYGQGKWYPGEPLPRWQYGLFWRKDHYPIWKNISLVAHEEIEKKYSNNDAVKFTKELAKHLAVNESNVSMHMKIYFTNCGVKEISRLISILSKLTSKMILKEETGPVTGYRFE